MEIISKLEQNILVKQSQLYDLYTNDYLTDNNNENLKLISELFFNNDVERAKKFNIWSNLFTTITDIITNFIGSPIIDIKLNLKDYIIDLLSVWQSVFWINRVENWTINWQLQVYYIPAKSYLFTNNEHKVIRLYSMVDKDKIKYYLLKQVFLVWFIENKLYNIKSISDTEWDEVALDTIPQTAWLLPLINTWLETVSLFSIKEQSQLDKIKSIIYSLDRKQTMFEREFLGEVEQYKIFENIYIPEYAKNSDGTVNLKKLWKVIATDTTLWTSWNVKYINNANWLIKEAINYEEKQIRKISSATSIPTDFLWVVDWWAISWTSREILMQSFIKKIETYRLLYDETLNKILNLFIQENQKKENWELITTSIVRKEIISKSDLEIINELKIAREAWLISQYSWIKLYMWFDDESTETELDKIKLETSITNTLNENNSGN